MPAILRPLQRRLRDVRADAVRGGWERITSWGAIGPHDTAGRRFGHFGEGSIICFPTNTIFNEHYIHIGAGTMLGPNITLSAGMMPGQQCISDPVVRIGDRCLIGKGSGIVGHFSIEIGNDVWTGHHVYITDQNHGYEDVTKPISLQTQPERSVVVGDGSWLGHGTIVLPGARIGRHVAVGANSVVTGELPDYCVAAGVPARVVRQYIDGEWRRPG
jgi:acetyltransferase-like isoleucine patch superfamily enzyme